MDQATIDLIHMADDHHKQLNKVRKLKKEVPRLREALIALERGKEHITKAYVQDSLDALIKVLDEIG